MQIRIEQMEELSDSMLQQFEGKMETHLRSRFAGKLAGTSDADLQSHIHEGVTRARRHGVQAKNDIRRYLEYTVEYGPDFDATCPWAASILEAKEMDGYKKMNSLDDYSTFELRG
ncbi:MAG: hypothetical protein ABJF23_26090 [Bryobacteraceae bacterium]